MTTNSTPLTRRIAKLLCAIMLTGTIATFSPRAEANCANMAAQGAGAFVGVIAQGFELIDRINNNKPGQTFQALVVLQSMVWAWWTASTWYCNCPKKNSAYCAMVLATPKPKNPGGNNGVPPVGPALPN